MAQGIGLNHRSASGRLFDLTPASRHPPVKPGDSLTLDEVVAFLKGRVADYKLPEELVVLNEFPMTPTGKIRRPELVKQVRGRG